jgi:hypothetical protein
MDGDAPLCGDPFVETDGVVAGLEVLGVIRSTSSTGALRVKRA